MQNTIQRYSKEKNNEKLRIATSWDRREPRLLVISVDVAEGKTVDNNSKTKMVEVTLIHIWQQEIKESQLKDM